MLVYYKWLIHQQKFLTILIYTGNGRYQYRFPTGNVNISSESKICLSSLTLPYSWFNIRAAYGNNQFTLTFPRAAGLTNTLITIDDGFYTVNDLNNYIKREMVILKYYMIDSS